MIFRLILLVIMGNLLFACLLYLLGKSERLKLHKRRSSILPLSNQCKVRIKRIYQLTLILFIVLYFLLIKLKVRGVS